MAMLVSFLIIPGVPFQAIVIPVAILCYGFYLNAIIPPSGEGENAQEENAQQENGQPTAPALGQKKTGLEHLFEEASSETDSVEQEESENRVKEETQEDLDEESLEESSEQGAV